MGGKCSITMIVPDRIHIGSFPSLNGVALGAFLWCDPQPSGRFGSE